MLQWLDKYLFTYCARIPSPNNYEPHLISFKSSTTYYDEVRVDVIYKGRPLFYYYPYEARRAEPESHLAAWYKDYQIYRRASRPELNVEA